MGTGVNKPLARSAIDIGRRKVRKISSGVDRCSAQGGRAGSEELREFRRRQLELETKNVLQQLETVSPQRLELEAEIARAETQAYHESAQPKPASVVQMFVARTSNTSRALLIALVAGVFVIAGGAIFLIRRFKQELIPPMNQRSTD